MRVIAAAGTSIAAFLGTADKDQPANTPIWVSTWQEFEDKFVDLDSTANPPLLTDSVYGWFTNGGGPCYVVRIPADQDTLQPALTALEDKARRHDGRRARPDRTSSGSCPQNQPASAGTRGLALPGHGQPGGACSTCRPERRRRPRMPRRANGGMATAAIRFRSPARRTSPTRSP